MRELIAIGSFEGMLPVRDDSLLGEVQASYAENVDLIAGTLRPVPEDAPFGGFVMSFDPEGAEMDPFLHAVSVSQDMSMVILSRAFDHAASLVDMMGDTLVYLAGPGADTVRVRRRRQGGGIIVTAANPAGADTPGRPVVTVIPQSAAATPTRFANIAATFLYADGTEGPLSDFSEEIAYVPGDRFSIAPQAIPPVSPAPVGIAYYITVPLESSNVPRVARLTQTTTPQFTTEGVLTNDIPGESYPAFTAIPRRLRTVAAAPWGGLAFTTPEEPGVIQYTDGTYLNRVYREWDTNVGANVTCLLRGAGCLFALCDDGGPFVVTGTALGNHILTPCARVEVLASGPRGAAVYNNQCVFAAPHGIVAVSADAALTPLTEGKIFDRHQWAGLLARNPPNLPPNIALCFASDGAVVFSAPSQGRTGVIRSYGLVWRTGNPRRALAVLPGDNSIVYC